MLATEGESRRRPTANKSSETSWLGFAGYLAETDCTTKLQDDSHDRDEWRKGRVKCDVTTLVIHRSISFPFGKYGLFVVEDDLRDRS